MVDPLSALALIKTGISAGKQLHSMSKEFAGFFDSVDDAKKAHLKKRNAMFASANEEAMATWTQMQNAKIAEEELREFITNTRGYSAYQELLKLRREIAQERRELERQAQVEKEEQKELIMTITVVLLMIVGSIMALGFFLKTRGIIE